MSTNPVQPWNYKAPPPRQPRRGDRVWTLRKDGRQTDAELRGHGEYGWEIQLLRDGEMYYGQRLHLRAQAVAHGEEHRRDLISKDWKPVEGERRG